MVVIPHDTFAQKIQHFAGMILDHLGFTVNDTDIRARLFVLFLILVCGLVVYLFFLKLLMPLIQLLINHSKSNFGKHFFKRHLLKRMMGLVTPVLMLILLPVAFGPADQKEYIFFQKVLFIVILFISGRIILAILDALYEILCERNNAVQLYKSVFQMVKLVVGGVILLFMISVVVNLRPLHIITGLSAFAAVLMLVFRDTILGFIAGIQLAHNKMVKIGDWITVPGTNANGVVTDINILTLQIQNFDNTYIYVPANNLVNGPFQNWSGMLQSGCWRVQEKLSIDIHSIVAIDEAWIDTLLSNQKITSLIGENGVSGLKKDKALFPEDFRTNLGVFRNWIKWLLANQKDVTPRPYQLIRENELSGTGVPLELYFFITSTSWLDGYHKQAVILEMLIEHIPLFQLKGFQFESLEQSSLLQKQIADTSSSQPAAK